MKILYRFGQELFWTMFWVFVALIVGFAILSFLTSRFSGNFIGTAASYVEQHAQPS